MKLVIAFVMLLGVVYGNEYTGDSRQLLIVSSSAWDAPRGKLQRYEKIDDKWQKIGAGIDVELGRKGLAWGRGLHKVPKNARNIKKEGDKKAPAGVFALPFSFGTKTFDISYPYKKMQKKDRCVDDSQSINYNKIIDSSKSPKDYNSYENMKLESGLYDYGIFVGHNPNQVKHGGSCIFLHIKKGDGKPTVGCTSLTRKEMMMVIGWLDSTKTPLLIQAPSSEMDRLFRP